MKIEEYVPERIPTKSARTNVRIDPPANTRSANRVMSTVAVVLRERPIVCTIE